MSIYEAIGVVKDWLKEPLPDLNYWNKFSQEERDRYWATEMIVGRLEEFLREQELRNSDEE